MVPEQFFRRNAVSTIITLHLIQTAKNLTSTRCFPESICSPSMDAKAVVLGAGLNSIPPNHPSPESAPISCPAHSAIPTEDACCCNIFASARSASTLASVMWSCTMIFSVLGRWVTCSPCHTGNQATLSLQNTAAQEQHAAYNCCSISNSQRSWRLLLIFRKQVDGDQNKAGSSAVSNTITDGENYVKSF